MSLEGIAQRYAQALFEIGTQAGNLPQLAEEIRRFGEAYETSAELRAVLDNPLVEEQPRIALLNDLATRLSASQVTKSTVGLLAQRHRLVLLPLVMRALDRLSDERAGVVRATVTTASQMGDGYYAKLKTELEKATGKKVVLERAVDPTLLGGVVTRIGDRVIDGSLKTRLQTMKTVLLQP